MTAPERTVPVVTVVTDLVTLHTAWRFGAVDRIVTPETGLPVSADFRPAGAAERRALRRQLGLSDHRFIAVLAGGAEGCGGIARRAAALITRFPDIEVVAICGRNHRLRRKLDRLAAQPRAQGRLHALGFTGNMADWLRCADIVVTKAGPGTIAEATASGVPLIITSHLPGQERGNTELVVSAGAGRPARTVPRLLREIGSLRRDPAALAAMRAASARLGRPGAAAGIAALLDEMIR